jgi:hypothetical protein
MAASTLSDERISWRQGSVLLERIMAEIRHELPASWFEYIDLDTAEVLFVVPTGQKGWVALIGHPGDASYEWVAHAEPTFVSQLGKDIYGGKRYEFSNCGYGVSSAALRDGLVKMTS